MMLLLLLATWAAARFVGHHYPHLSDAFVHLGCWLVGILLMFVLWDRESVLALLCVPARFLSAIVNFIKSLTGEILTWRLQRSAWKFLNDLSLGLNGYPFQSAVSQKPNSIAEEFYAFLDLPERVEERALERRRNSASSAYEILSEALGPGAPLAVRRPRDS